MYLRRFYRGGCLRLLTLRTSKKGIILIVLPLILIAGLFTSYHIYLNRQLGDPGFYEFPNVPPRDVDFVKQVFSGTEIPLSPAPIEPEINSKYSQTFVDLNVHLLNLGYKYFNVYVGDNKLSPLFPLALANVEHADWADSNKTFSALIPSKYVSCNNIHDINNYSVLSLFQTESAYKGLSTEGARGSIPMSVGYGTAGISLPSELEIVSDAYPTGEYPSWIAEWWVRGIAKESGDRFSIEGSVSRLSSACSQTTAWLSQEYVIDREVQAVALLSLAFVDANTFNPSASTKSDRDDAFNYAISISSTDALAVIRRYAETTYPNKSIDTSVALSLLDEMLLPEDIGSTLTDKELSYPIQTLYAYIQVGCLYSGK